MISPSKSNRAFQIESVYRHHCMITRFWFELESINQTRMTIQIQIDYNWSLINYIIKICTFLDKNVDYIIENRPLLFVTQSIFYWILVNFHVNDNFLKIIDRFQLISAYIRNETVNFLSTRQIRLQKLTRKYRKDIATLEVYIICCIYYSLLSTFPLINSIVIQQSETNFVTN